MNIISLDYERAALFFKRLVLVVSAASLTQAAHATKVELPLGSCEEILQSLSTVSFDSVFEDMERHPAFPELASIYRTRTAADQSAIDLHLTENHLRKEMSFQVRNPTTGYYDKFVAVPVSGHVAPMLKADYDRLVQSTAPVLRALRALLQKAYSQKNWTAESLGLGGIPADEAEIVMRVLRESIYLEPALNAPRMAKYPFLAVSGFDGAIVDPRRPQNVFFEMNLGTPSGISNNAELLSDLKNADPAVYQAIQPYLPADDTHSLLRDTIERNARAWTHKAGISVVISPGIYNGAHPDVAAVAQRSGMPLVKSSDLYEDANGHIRLNTGAGNQDPVVNGIYNRMEESFVLQSAEDKIPLISPQYEDPAALSTLTGVQLRAGAIYKWIYGDNGKITGVEKDAEGNPIFEEVWDTIGKDPARPEAPRGSFARAVLSGRLYVSNIGGRLVDDKRLFRIVSQYLVDRTSRNRPASPVLSLSPNNLGALYRNPDNFVIKAPANSGGVGIHFPRVMAAAEKLALLERVKAKPSDFEIQYISPLVTLPKAVGADFRDVAIDLRLFVMMNEAGEVGAGVNSLLLRTANPGGLKSNTSDGGGYGIGVVLDKKPGWHRWGSLNSNSYHPRTASDTAAAKDLIGRLKDFSADIEAAIEAEQVSTEASDLLRGRAKILSNDLRGVLHLLSGPMAALPSYFRDFAEGTAMGEVELTHLLRHIDLGFNSLRNAGGPVGFAFFDLQRNDYRWWERQLRRLEDPTSPAYSPLNAKITYRKLEEPVVAYYWQHGDNRTEKYEMAEIISVNEPVIQKMIDFVRANGGEVRLMKSRKLLGKEDIFAGWSYESPYFWVNLDPNSKSFLKPVIGIDLTGDRGLAALSHEMEHFKIWLEHYKAFLASGMAHEAAVRAAVDKVWEQDMIVYGERRAVAAEMQAERDYPNNVFNQSMYRIRPLNFWEKGYLNRILYPEFEAVRQVLHQHVNLNKDLDMGTLRKYMTLIVLRSLELKRQAATHFQSSPDPVLEDYWKFSSISELVTKPYGIERLSEQQTTALFNQYLDEICREITGGTERCQ